MKISYDNEIKDYVCFGDDTLISVVSVLARENYCLELTFSNGETKLYNALPLLEKSMYSTLKNVSLFQSAKVDCGTVVWNDGDIDIAPEKLFEDSVPYSGGVNV